MAKPYIDFAKQKYRAVGISTKIGLCGILQTRGDFKKFSFNDVPYTAADAQMYVMDFCDNEIEERGR